MSNLRSKLIRLAHAKPELRKDLLPLLKVADKKNRDGYYPKDTIMVSKNGDETLKIVGHKVNTPILHQRGYVQYDYVVHILSGRRSGRELWITMDRMDQRYSPKFGKKASDEGYEVTIYEKVVSPESLEHGDYKSQEEVADDWFESLEDLIDYLKRYSWIEWSSSRPNPKRDWLISQADENYRTGDSISYTAHIKGLSQKDMMVLNKELRVS